VAVLVAQLRVVARAEWQPQMAQVGRATRERNVVLHRLGTRRIDQHSECVRCVQQLLPTSRHRNAHAAHSVVAVEAQSQCKVGNYSWPLPVMKVVASVRKIESGLEFCQWLPKKARITVLMQ
jgi:hypothetical protein